MRDGHVLWDFNTVQEFTTVNCVAAHGGALDGRDQLSLVAFFYQFRYDRFGGMPGNVLSAFSEDGK